MAALWLPWMLYALPAAPMDITYSCNLAAHLLPFTGRWEGGCSPNKITRLSVCVYDTLLALASSGFFLQLRLAAIDTPLLVITHMAYSIGPPGGFFSEYPR